MKRCMGLLLVLGMLLGCIGSGLTGDPSDPFVDLGLFEAMKNTQYEGWRHQYSIYYQEGLRAAAILNSEQERALFLLAPEKGQWQIAAILPNAVCQGQYCFLSVYSQYNNPTGGSLIIEHQCSVYTSEVFAFAHNGAEWVFDYAYFRTPTGDYNSDEVYSNPMELAYVTWDGDALVFDWYIDDHYGAMPNRTRLEILEGWAWIKGDRPSYAIPYPDPITLTGFEFDTFPRDALTMATKELPEYQCNQKLGTRDPNVDYAVVNNPNPKDRLNLRKEADAKSEYLGKYYNGMEVRVISETVDGWARVYVGNNTVGYMRREFLAYNDAGSAVKNAMPQYTAPAHTWNLLHSPFDDSHVKEVMAGGEAIEVMGVVSGWWHIRCNDETGYIRGLVNLE